MSRPAHPELVQPDASKVERETVSPWSPLAQPIFRALWIATVASNIGTWMQDVGESWVMVSLTPDRGARTTVRRDMAWMSSGFRTCCLFQYVFGAWKLKGEETMRGRPGGERGQTQTTAVTRFCTTHWRCRDSHDWIPLFTRQRFTSPYPLLGVISLLWSAYWHRAQEPICRFAY
jgi:Transmembrane secretion effector